MREEKKEKQRLNILESAAAVFSEKGFAKATMSDVAAKASIGKGTIYGYFKSKDDLFFEVFSWYNDKIMENVGGNIFTKDIPARKKISDLTISALNSVKDMMDFYSLTLEFWAAAASTEKRDDFKDEFLSMYDVFIALIKSILDEGVKNKEFLEDTDTENTARGIISMLDALGLQFWLGQKFDLIYSGRNIVNTLLNGITIRD